MINASIALSCLSSSASSIASMSQSSRTSNNFNSGVVFSPARLLHLNSEMTQYSYEIFRKHSINTEGDVNPRTLSNMYTGSTLSEGAFTAGTFPNYSISDLPTSYENHPGTAPLSPTICVPGMSSTHSPGASSLGYFRNTTSNLHGFTDSEDQYLYNAIEANAAKGRTGTWGEIKKAVGGRRTEEMCHHRWNKELQPAMGESAR